MEISKLKRVHFIGVGGIGMSAIAMLFLERNIKVTGSDLNTNKNVDALIKKGAKIVIGPHSADNVAKDTQLVIYSSAVEAINPERQKSDKLKIESLDYHAALGLLTAKADTVVVTGTHGKTTTTAMLGLILAKTDFNPTVIVGSNVKEFGGNLRIGDFNNFVVEGDEYRKGILELHPETIVLTNVEYDHPDIYEREEHYTAVFQDFINKLPRDGRLIYNMDDHNSHERMSKPDCHIATFSITNPRATLTPKNIKIAHGRQIFRLVYNGQELKDFNIKLPGRHNISNALAAALAALEMGVDQDTIKDALAVFTGAERRFEVIGTLNGGTVISDYAHHPTELTSVIQATKEFYPDREIIVYFQPHQKARTKELLSDFIHSLKTCPADKLYINEIYDVPGRSEGEKISSNDIVKGVTGKKIEFVESLEAGKKLMKKVTKKESVLLVVGAGDIDSAMRGIVEPI